MKKFLSKVKFLGQGQRWWGALLFAAIALVAPLASHASEFPGMGAAYAQRLEQYRKISSLWLAPQALQSTVPQPALGRGVGQPPPTTYYPLTTIAPWSTRGAYEDWAHIDLPDTFRFPVGLEYIPRITVMAWGEVRGIAELPRRVSLEPGVSSVSHGPTPSNSYLFAWHNCCVERCATNRVDASIELFDSGAVAIRTSSDVQPPTYNLQPHE